MAIKTAIIGLGIMGRRMLTQMRSHTAFEPNYLWDPSAKACALALLENPSANITESASLAISSADLVYLACPPDIRRTYAIEAAKSGKAIFLEKPLGINIESSRDLVSELEKYGIPTAVNVTQAAGVALSSVLEEKNSGRLGELEGIDIVLTYGAWPREWQKAADWLRYKAEGGMTREVISHFLFFSERILGPLKIIWSNPTFPSDSLLCESHLHARLETENGCPVNIMASVGGAQPDRQELTIKGSLKSRRVSDFYRDSESTGGDFISVREEPQDPRASSLGAQLDDLKLLIDGFPHRLATVNEALSVQILIEGILSGKP
jgi:predicted dehydrogenase